MGTMWKELTDSEKEKFVKQSAALKEAYNTKHDITPSSRKVSGGAGAKKVPINLYMYCCP